MRIAFSTLPLSGHTIPMFALARRVQTRGHQVVFIGHVESGAAVRAAGFDFIPFCQDRYAPGELAAQFNGLSTLSGYAGFEFTMNILADACRAIMQDGARALRDSRADALIVDVCVAGLEAIAMTLGMPYIHVSTGLPDDMSGYTPVSIYDWSYNTSPGALARNRAGLIRYGKALLPIADVIRKYLDHAGFSFDWSQPYGLASKLAWLTQVPKEFDFPNDYWPPQLHHLGPFADGVNRARVDFPWDRLTGEPLIYASMGTLQNGLAHVFRILAEAGEAPGRQLVIVIGRNLTADQVGPVAPNTIVVPYAPQLELLKKAKLCITHAGLNTTLEALSQGVPMVAIPITNDQPGIASRIAFTRTGMFIPFRDLATDKLRSSIDEVLSDPVYLENARRFRRLIEQTDGLELAADCIERAFGR